MLIWCLIGSKSAQDSNSKQKDAKNGPNKISISEWNVVENSKVTDAILFANLAYYNLLRDVIDLKKFDKYFTIDTLLNFAIVNNQTLAKFSCDVLVSLALRSKEFMDRLLFYRLCRKLTQFDETFVVPERDKLSDYVRYEHKTITIWNLVRRSLHGHYLSTYNKDLKLVQPSIKNNEESKDGSTTGFILSQNTLIYLLISANFNEKVGHKYLKTISKYYELHGVNFHNVIDEISQPLIDKLATKLFMFSDREHMRKLAVNTCGSVSSIHPNFCGLVSKTFPLQATIEQVRKCLKCQAVFDSQCSHISFYDMNHIADNAGALLEVIPDKIREAAANKPEPEVEKEEEVVEVKAAPKSMADMNKLLLGGGAKKGAKPKKGGATKKAEGKPKPADKPKNKSQVVEEAPKPVVEGKF